jgi:hypothetical protein
MIAEAITLAAERGDPAGQAEQRMIENWQELQRYGKLGLLRYTISPRKFIADAHWRTDAMWPFDEERLREKQRAAVGR